MDELTLLILLVIAMLFGSLIAGYVPMFIKLSDNKSRLLALVGAGILCGTALVIIIPEGFQSLADAATNKTQTVDNKTLEYIDKGKIAYWIIGPSLVVGFLVMFLIDQFNYYISSLRHASTSQPERQGYTLTNQDDDDDEETELRPTESQNYRDQTDSEPNTSEATPIRQHDHRQQRVSLRGGDDNRANVEVCVGEDSSYHSTINNEIRHRQPKVTPTLGLVIHAAADGIALGAAATTPRQGAQFIVFLAIMLHKGPAAFSLVVLLLHNRLKRSTIRWHLLAFSISAPLLTLVTYFSLSQSSREALSESVATGSAMLFSAGTFLYVATVHVLPELIQSKLLPKKELFCLVCGLFFPLILALIL